MRYSEFLRLPYWNPIDFVAIDSMYGFYLGILARHCRSIWGFDIKAPDGDGTGNRFTPPDRPAPEEMNIAYETFKNCRSLNKLSVGHLYHLCADYGCLPVARSRKKYHLVNQLNAYVSDV